MSQDILTLTKVGDNRVTVAQVKEEFKNVTLTEEEEASGYLYAYKNKLLKLKQQKEESDRLLRIANHKAMWSFEECYNYALKVGEAIGKQRGFDFIIDDENKEVFRLLALYYSNDPRFEEMDWFGEKLSLQKGICLVSPVRGNGKTTLLDCFMYNKRGCYGKISTKFIGDEFNMFGLYQIQKYMWLIDAPPTPLNFFQDKIGFHYDDFADEPPVIHMGQHKLISADIINSLYDKHRDEPRFHQFPLSMNYKWSEYEAKFGSNTASRISETYNLLKMPGETRRGPSKKKR